MFAIAFAEEIAIIQELSTKHEVGVATEYYGRAFRSDAALLGSQLDAICAAKFVPILRAAFADREPYLPARLTGSSMLYNCGAIPV